MSVTVLCAFVFIDKGVCKVGIEYFNGDDVVASETGEVIGKQINLYNGEEMVVAKSTTIERPRGMNKDVAAHKEVLNRCSELYAAKNGDYGNSISDNYNKWEGKLPNGGLLTISIRLWDKLNRLDSYIAKGELLVRDEGIVDTLMDVINYAAAGIVELENR